MKWVHRATNREVKDLGGFPIIYADPPWQYKDRKCEGGAEHHYETMSLDEIKALPVADLAAKDAVLFMWGTYPLLPEMLELGAAWDFKYLSIGFQWIKRYTKSGAPFFGLGRWTRGNTEGCFIFKRGKPSRISAAVSQLIETDDPSVVWPPYPAQHILDAPIGRHSAKPPIVRDRIIQLMGDLPAIELFAREQAPGWENWGAEVTSSVRLEASPSTPMTGASAVAAEPGVPQLA